MNGEWVNAHQNDLEGEGKVGRAGQANPTELVHGYVI